MSRVRFGEAIDAVVASAMAGDERVIVLGEDVHLLRPELLAQFGAARVLSTPISESAFVGAGVGAAMAGLRPIVEVMMVDFIAVAMDAVLNHLAKLEGLSGGRWRCPLVIRAACGGGYGDGGQHQQCLWGMLAGIPGLTVVAPSTPADAAGLMRTAIEHDGPVIFMEHKLLSEAWLEFLGRGGRQMLEFDVPPAGAEGEVGVDMPAVPFGQAVVRRAGSAVSIVSLAVGVHRALGAAAQLDAEGIDCEVIDLRSLRPLDAETIAHSVRKTGRLIVLDEDYQGYGLSGEVAATVLEAGLRPRYRRLAVTDTLPFARELEMKALPCSAEVVAAARELCA